MIKQKPRIKIADIFAAMMIFLGFLMFIIMLHILAINTTGNTQDVLNTVFIVFLRIWEYSLIFAFAAVIIHILRYLVWQITTPKWLKNKFKNEGKI